MFRITEDPSTGNLVQHLAKITKRFYCVRRHGRPGGLRPIPCRGFQIILRHTKLGRILLG